MFSTHVYPSGLTLITVPMKSTQSVTALILVGAGSRYETPKINGISHYLEHMFFKGAQRYPTSHDVSSAVDELGAEMNAFTGKEYAGYYIKIAAKHLDKSLDILSDMLINPTFDPAEIDKERGVIMEEYNMYQDTPMYQVQWDFERLIFGDQPLGWDEVGTKECIMSIQQKDFQSYKNMLYGAKNTVITLAGNFDEQEARAMIERYFEFSLIEKNKEFDAYKPHTPTSRVSVTNKKTEQAHLVLGVEGLDYFHPDRYVQEVIATILGGNMSSRMFQKIREDRGLAYYVQSSFSDYKETGVFYTRAGVSLKDIDDVVRLIQDEYRLLANEPVTEKELTKAKEFIKGKMMLSFEDTETVAHFYGRQKLLRNEVKDPQDITKNIDLVTLDDLSRVSKDLFGRPMYLSVIGPFDTPARFESLM